MSVFLCGALSSGSLHTFYGKTQNLSCSNGSFLFIQLELKVSAVSSVGFDLSLATAATVGMHNLKPVVFFRTRKAK